MAHENEALDQLKRRIIIALLDGTLTVPVSGATGGGAASTVALDTATLAALESISVQNFPATQNTDPIDRAARLLGVTSLDAATLAALESISVQNFPTGFNVNNAVALDVATLAALESVSLNTNTPDVTDRAARLLGIISNADPTKTTYSAATAALAGAASDIFTLSGSATKTVRVTRLGISGTQTTAGTANLSLLKRTAANTGGTSSTITAIKHDTNDANPTAVVTAYTVAPTAVGAGNLTRSAKLFVPTATSGLNPAVFDFGVSPNKPIILRGTTELLAVNIGTALTGASYAIFAEWTEE